MRGFSIEVRLADGSLLPLSFSGEELITRLAGEDTGPPPVSLSIVAETQDGRQITFTVANDERRTAHVSIKRNGSRGTD